MYKATCIFFLSLFIFSCGSSKQKLAETPQEVKSYQIYPEKSPETRREKPAPKKEETAAAEVNEKPTDLRIGNLINIARSFNGTRYKFGGTTTAGMDCSGLVYTVFREEDIILPRSSRDMATKGNKISYQEIKEGDLVFFKTNGQRNSISHVGLVVEVQFGKIFFIHSSTSQGVITSSLDENYWSNTFVEARRVL
jgi:cell wall-associated NlpC family hydrolase